MPNYVARTLSRTDVGESKTHQAAIRLSEREALRIFPESWGKKDPHEFDCEDHAGKRWKFKYTNRRSGPRIRPIEDYLQRYSIRPGDTVTICAPESKGYPYRIYLDRHAPGLPGKKDFKEEPVAREKLMNQAVCSDDARCRYRDSEDGKRRYCYSTDTEERYRYSLEVKLSGKSGVCLFLMLNPSAEDEEREHESSHPTRKRCMEIADRKGYGTLLTCNLFALRTRDPKKLKHHADPVGPENNQHILRKARESDLIVCAWGNKRTFLKRGSKVVDMLKDAGLSKKMRHIGRMTAKGQPRHPLDRTQSPYVPLQRFAST